MSAITVLTVTFFIAQMFILLSIGSQQILKYFETKPQISAYFTDETPEVQILAYKQTLEKNPYVKSATYISKDDALKIYREQNKDDTLLLEMVTADILPASLELAPTSLEYTEQITNELSGLQGLEELVYQQDVIETLTNWTQGVRYFGMSLIAFLVLTSMLIIVIIVGMKVASKRHEIRIMQLLGANKWFIVGPFLFEGAIYGFLGATIAWGMNYLVLLYATPYLLDFLGDIPLLPADPVIMLSILAIATASGVIIGMSGGSVAVRRYFKK
ncbi:cell division protein FtsX [Patescibacteria group bacterium]